MPTPGTLAEYITVPTHRLHEQPPHLSDEQAAALPLAALTAFRAVFRKGEVATSKKVLITGIGGGVALFALQFTLAAGAEVYVNSGSDEKLEKARSLGAYFGINYHQDKWFKALQEKNPSGFDAIIDGAGGAAFGELTKMLAPAGNMVVYGTTAGQPSPLHLPRLFFSQGAIKGSTMGNDEEFRDMVAWVSEKQIVPVISSVRPFEEVISAFDEMAEGKQFGKLVIKIA
ncbi:MAG: zinc-binding dehydrogenase, partial [Bacteroidia bacterium]|nr:zinc-binding dehydrogenase [Bacteroidia bacterium]